MNVFVLCTGRCGSLTFARAASHITNFTSAHEANLKVTGEKRLEYPDQHIEIDNRLAWFLGRLDQRYGNQAFYVHLKRERRAVALSYSKRNGLGFIMHAYARGVYVGLPDELDWVTLGGDFYDTVNANIELFLKDKTHQMTFVLENAARDFPRFWQFIEAEGDLETALAEWEAAHNATEEQASSGVLYALPERYLDQMRQRIPGEHSEFLATGRMHEIEEHLAHLRQEFIGQAELNFTLATCIVHIRRREKLDQHLALFFQLLAHPVTCHFLVEQLSIRWLVSVADTLADHGAPTDSAAAIILVTLVNMIKLAESERCIMTDPSHNEAKLEKWAEQFAVPLFGGLTWFNPRRGDMPRNLFARIERQVSHHPFLRAAYQRLLTEFKIQPNLLNRLATYNDRFWK